MASSTRLLRRAAVATAAPLLGLAALAAPAQAAGVSHPITFPLDCRCYHYSDDFGAPRSGHTHQGNDVIAPKLTHIVAAQSGVITRLAVGDVTKGTGNMLFLRGDDGWVTWYIHINNDTPGTDDGANPAQWRFAPGIVEGMHVSAGQLIAYVGDSGDAESTVSHLHFELHEPDGTVIDPFPSLQAAEYTRDHPVPIAPGAQWRHASGGVLRALFGLAGR